jgi:AAA domain
MIASPAANPATSHAHPQDAKLQQLGIYTSQTLDSLCLQEGQKPFVVEGLISTGSIGIVVGDSGLGKSPLLYQLALSVAAGIPWLGMRTSPGPVLYLDFENGPMDSQALRDSVLRHLELPCPENFRSCYHVSDMNHLTHIVEAAKPSLVIIDTLRSFDPSAEENNTKAGSFIKSLRAISQAHRTAFLFIHHIKKQGTGFLSGNASIEGDSILQWLNQACGARALVNQTDFRIGVDRTSKASASLIVRGHVRIRGEFGPLYLARAFDDAEEPIGYCRLFGVEFLENKDQQTAFDKLPLAFSFKEAKAVYGRQDEATNSFLKKCALVGIVRKVAKGRYEKVPCATSE